MGSIPTTRGRQETTNQTLSLSLLVPFFPSFLLLEGTTNPWNKYFTSNKQLRSQKPLTFLCVWLFQSYINRPISSSSIYLLFFFQNLLNKHSNIKYSCHFLVFYVSILFFNQITRLNTLLTKLWDRQKEQKGESSYGRKPLSISLCVL